MKSSWALPVGAAVLAVAVTVGVGQQAHATDRPMDTAAQSQELPEGVTPEMVEEGEQIFAGDGLCATCHGTDGTGTPMGPDLTDGEWLHIDGSYDQIVELVMNGVQQPEQYPTPMVPRGGSDISDEQVRSVSAYVWTLSSESAEE